MTMKERFLTNTYYGNVSHGFIKTKINNSYELLFRNSNSKPSKRY